jgi:peptidylprolyl isomerase
VSSDDLRSAESVVTGLTVSGDPGRPPVVRMRTPLEIDETTTAVTVSGTGAPIQVDQLFVIELTLYDARTGEKAISTYDTGRAIAAKSSDDTLFPVLNDALLGAREGSRVVVAATAEDAYARGGEPPEGVAEDDPVVLVADVVAVPPVDVLAKAEGEPVAHVPGTPTVRYRDGTESAVDFTGVERPEELRAYAQVNGTGPVVDVHDVITVDYLAQRAGERDPFEDTFFKEPVQVALGTGTAPPAWDKFLVGVHAGTRLVIYGPDKRGMIAWVVDVLGVN